MVLEPNVKWVACAYLVWEKALLMLIPNDCVESLLDNDEGQTTSSEGKTTGKWWSSGARGFNWRGSSQVCGLWFEGGFLGLKFNPKSHMEKIR